MSSGSRIKRDYVAEGRARLDRRKCRQLAASSMTEKQLWSSLLRELDKAVDAGELFNTREAFYAACRAQLVASELYVRGVPLTFFPEDEYRDKPEHPN